mmetsp:Transcript_34419/g.69544  ORF Transcript_34419/g.69544 Transcript_34419/m.69544 type:complete len:138 (-) Transcript_34419:44-457(-)
MAARGVGPAAPGWLLGTLHADSSRVSQPGRPVEAAPPPAATPTLTGKLMGDEPRVIAVHIDGAKEEVEIDGENGPIWVQRNGTKKRGAKLTDVLPNGYTWDSRHKKPWSAMGATEREALLIIAAKRQQALRESRREQ